MNVHFFVTSIMKLSFLKKKIHINLTVQLQWPPLIESVYYKNHQCHRSSSKVKLITICS